MGKKLEELRRSTTAPQGRVLIKRKRLVAKAPYVVRMTVENTVHFLTPERGHILYALVGQIAMEWTSLEEMLNSCIGVLANHTHAPITACITAQMIGHNPRCLTIKALAQWRGLTEIARETERLRNKLFEVSEQRNRAIHDRILIESEEKTAFKDHRMSKGELHYGLREFDQKKLEQTIEAIRHHHRLCMALLNSIRDQVYEDEP